MMGLMPIGSVCYPIRIQMKEFGSYRHVLILLGIQVLVSQVMTVIGIFAALLSQVDNIFSAAGPEAGHLGHAVIHLVS
jgi:hypothetical protein